MRTIAYYLLCSMLTLLMSCTSSDLVENWKNPDIDTFYAEKVLVIAMTNDVDNRKRFEKRLVNQLQSKGVKAIESDQFFDENYTQRPHTQEELDALENAMLQEGYDAILVSKIIGAEDRKSLLQSYEGFDTLFNSFEEDYYSNQKIYTEGEYADVYTVYHAESSLYCICPTKDREIIWRGSIDITQPDSTRKAIKDYINVLLWVLEEQKLLITSD
ncbi:hypothetical protein SAMN06265376_106156 [Dokdonia pacifica]|uniref:Cardiolipin synthetase n=2 Tax=Dokdonia pacifica TaxID=1627892 RepID=A0A239BGA6_9FLAO|nr:hypothetical protein SAMN06265376_106156 [Dokdonia pacifica]